ncbi:hypothetical protein HERIO_2144 [Hepatospora eriocheir]|uniref:Uncharacterized protein n=1 Tax=Hepatospora eriocheir TaxID=1081669 RepID=A0A1X0Q838_9MICR|nr:hypothetical protein HERIO_2144 [Hepatospora eriocheir]
MRSILISILNSVVFLLSSNTIVVDRVRCEDTLISEEITTFIEELNSLFRNIQVSFLKEVLNNLKENDKTIFNKKKALKECHDKLNEIKLNDKNYKEKIKDVLNELVIT